MGLKAAGFDIDGTLYPDRQVRWRSLPYCLSHASSVMAFSRARKQLRGQADSSGMPQDADEAEIKCFAEIRGISAESARLLRDRVIYSGWEKCFRRVKPFAHVREALLSLREAGLKIAALSDFPVGKKLEYLGVEDLFDVTLGFPESLQLKPRPEPFLLMAQKLQTEPQDIIYVGNRIDYDIYGAQNAGIRGLLIAPKRRRTPPGIVKFSDFRSLSEYILSEVSQ